MEFLIPSYIHQLFLFLILMLLNTGDMRLQPIATAVSMLHRPDTHYKQLGMVCMCSVSLHLFLIILHLGVGPPNPMFNHPLQIPPQGTLAPTGQIPGAIMGVPMPLEPSPAPTNSVKRENPDGSDDESLVKEEKNTDDEEGTTPSIPPLIHDLIVIFSQTTRGA